MSQLFAQVFGVAGEDGYDSDEGRAGRREVAEDLGALWAANIIDGPRFEVAGPRPVDAPGARADRLWGQWATTFTYVFDPARPWFAHQVVQGFRAAFADAEGRMEAPRLAVKMRIEAASIDLAGRPRHYPAAGGAQAAADNHGHPRNLAAFPRGGATDADWDAVTRAVEAEDRYDRSEGIDTVFGNRMSRVVFIVNEWRVPRGRGKAAKALGVPARSLVDLPLPEGCDLCGQACLAYLLAPAAARANHRRPDRPTALNAAALLAAQIGVPGPMGFADFDRVALLDETAVVTILEGRTDVAYRTPQRPGAPVYLYILYREGHYTPIAAIEAFARATPKSRDVWCHTCAALVARRDVKGHACNERCARCLHRFAGDPDRAAHYAACPDTCGLCNFAYRFAGCRAAHRCDKWLCPACQGVYPMARAAGHVCNEAYCRYCDEYSTGVHRCYVLPKAAPADPAPPNYWAYDIECTLDRASPDAPPQHNIAVLVATQLYTRATAVFGAPGAAGAVGGADAADAFLTHLEAGGFGRAPVLVAHNGSSYDAYLVLRQILGKRLAAPKVVMAGAKIMLLTYAGARFLDSMCHVSGSLAGLIPTFGLATPPKGFFPYRFFTRANRDYAGAAPEAAWFDCPDARLDEFGRWHAGLAGPYALLDECVRYCRQDVDILAAAMEKYRDAGLAATRLDPLRFVTAAAYAQALYRTAHMPARSMPILSRGEDDFVRRGFYGGRTDARQVYRCWTPADVEAGHGAAYLDVVSMYPAVQRYDALPCGAPWWAEDLPSGDGCHAWLAGLQAGGLVAMVDCEVVCPPALYHPVLLSRVDGRLLATLGDADHRLAGVWPSAELDLAVEKGYTVTRVVRALCSAASTGLFASYVDVCLQAKQRHAPRGPEPNAGLYLVAKSTLNSLWGKFAQRDCLDEARIFQGDRAPAAWYRVVDAYHGGRIADIDVLEAGPDYLFASITRPAGDALVIRTTSLMLAAFVTARGRIRLYAMLDRLGERVMYHDTDSVVYAREPGADVAPEAGLGAWSDATARDGRPDYIAEFVALGPKTYAYRTVGGQTCVKAKGFAAGFTLEQYRGLALAYLKGLAVPPLVQPRLHFVRRDGELLTAEGYTKRLVTSLQKMQVVRADRTLPYGYAGE